MEELEEYKLTLEYISGSRDICLKALEDIQATALEHWNRDEFDLTSKALKDVEEFSL